MGYGNIDRQDDGVAWYVLYEIKQILSPEKKLDPGDIVSLGKDQPDLFFYPQLTPEIADIASDYDAVCFVDCHTGSFPEDIRITEIESHYQTSAFTHHMTPGTILALIEMMHHKKIGGLLVSVKGYEFKFDQTLSSNTQELIKPAVKQILTWVEKIKGNENNPVTG